MNEHLQKEELILFPRIRKTERILFGPEDKELYHFINGPIAVMENEHEHAAEILSAIRELTSNYIPPESACMTFRIALQELKEFETDLHEHVHLENNILFRKAKAFVE